MERRAILAVVPHVMHHSTTIYTLEPQKHCSACEATRSAVIVYMLENNTLRWLEARKIASYSKRYYLYDNLMTAVP